MTEVCLVDDFLLLCKFDGVLTIDLVSIKGV